MIKKKEKKGWVKIKKFKIKSGIKPDAPNKIKKMLSYYPTSKKHN
jgi:hypothetical protein